MGDQNSVPPSGSDHSAEPKPFGLGPSGECSSREAPRDGSRFLAVVDGEWRFVAYGKVSHVPIYGYVLVDQGAEEAELCEFTHWCLLPELPQ